MATRAILTPFSAEFPSANQPQLDLVNRRPVLWFDDTTDETCYWTIPVVPQGLTGTLSFVVQYIMASAVTGNIGFDVSIEAITPDSDTLDLDASTQFDTDNVSAADAVPGTTAGRLGTLTITLTNDGTPNALASADYLRIRFNRNTGVTGNASGDGGVLGCEFRDAA